MAVAHQSTDAIEQAGPGRDSGRRHAYLLGLATLLLLTGVLAAIAWVSHARFELVAMETTTRRIAVAQSGLAMLVDMVDSQNRVLLDVLRESRKTATDPAQVIARFRSLRFLATELYPVSAGVASPGATDPAAPLPRELMARLTRAEVAGRSRVTYGPVQRAGLPALVVATRDDARDWLVAVVDMSAIAAFWMQRNLPRDGSVVIFDAEASRGFELPARAGAADEQAANPILGGAPPSLLAAIARAGPQKGRRLIDLGGEESGRRAHVVWSAPDGNGLRVAATISRAALFERWLGAYGLPIAAFWLLAAAAAAAVTVISLRMRVLARTREQNSQALALSEERLRLALASSGDGLWDWDLPSNAIYYSPRFAELLRYRGTGFSADFDPVAALHPEDRDAALAALRRAIEQREAFDHEFRWRRFDGSWGWFRARGRPRLGASGLPLRFSGTLTDHSRQKAGEQALRAREALFRQVFEKSLAIQLLIDPHDGRIVDANDAACAFYRYPREQLLALRVADLNTLPAPTLHSELKRAAGREAGRFEFRHRLADGEIRDVEVYSTPIETELGSPLLSIVHDVSRSRQAEDALLTAFRRLRMHRDVIDRALIVAIADAGWHIRYANDHLCAISGRSRDELIGRDGLDLIGAPNADEIVRATATGAVWRGVVEIAGRAGARWLETTIVPEVSPDGLPFRYTAISVDVTSRIAAERRSQVVQARYDALFARNPGPIGIYAVATRHLLDVNDALVGSTGKLREELVAHPVDVLFHPDDGQALAAALSRAECVEALTQLGVWRMRRTGGAYDEADVAVTPVEFDGVPARLLMTRAASAERIAEIAIAREQALGGLIHRLQSRFILAGDVRTEFAPMLVESLAFTESTIGFVAEVADIAAPPTRLRMVARATAGTGPEGAQACGDVTGVEFALADCGPGVAESLVRNEPCHGVSDAGATCFGLAGGRGETVGAFLVVPLTIGTSVVGAMGLANRAGGYDGAYVERMQPLFATFANLLAALRAEDARRASEAAALRIGERLALATGVAGIGVFEWELSTGVIIANDRFCEIFGCTRESLLNPVEAPASRLLAMVHEEDRAGLEATIAGFSPRRIRQVSHRYRIRRENGAVRTLSGSWTVEDGTHLVGVVVDITEESRLEEEHEARIAAEAANHAKTEFLSRMSHELRTPLNAILGFAQLLELDTKAPLTASQRSHVGNVQTAGWHLLAMIDDILDLSRIEAGTLAISAEPVNVESLIAEARSMVAHAAQARSLRIIDSLRLPAPARVRADRRRLLQVLLNLLSNAIKYNRDEGTIRIGRIADSGRIRIWVSDTGPGLRREQLDRLFTPFDRLGAEASDVEGAGIGLVVTRGLLEQMDGRIEVESEPGAGSTFTIDLPEAPAGSPRMSAAESGTGAQDAAV